MSTEIMRDPHNLRKALRECLEEENILIEPQKRITGRIIGTVAASLYAGTRPPGRMEVTWDSKIPKAIICDKEDGTYLHFYSPFNDNAPLPPGWEDRCLPVAEAGNLRLLAIDPTDLTVSLLHLMSDTNRRIIEDMARDGLINREGVAARAKAAFDEYAVRIDYLEDSLNMALGLIRKNQMRMAVDVNPDLADKIAAAKTFVFDKWCERAHELGHREPEDLSSSCKFSSLFASHIFDGEMMGSEDHQFVELKDGSILDLNEDAADVRDLYDPYEHDEEFWMNDEHAASMASCHSRVAKWIEQWEHEVAPDFDHDPNVGLGL